MSKDALPIYKELIDIFVTRGGTISFKSISAPRQGIKNIQSALSDLYYLLLTKGIDHEKTTGRAPLPRIINVWKDLEEPGADKILMATLADKMRQAARTIYDNQLIIENFVAMDSKTSVFLQMADIIASSVNRIQSRKREQRNHKDELADHLVDRLSISATPDEAVLIGDLAVLMTL
jgi:hypothetical protein